MLQPVDLAVAFDAAWRRARDGRWTPAVVRDDLGLAWSSIHLSLRRLEAAGLVRGDRVNRAGLAALLPVLQFLVPATPDTARRVRGIPTGPSAPVFEERILSRQPLVWAWEDGPVAGIPIRPLYAGLPGAVRDDPERYALFACLDALRGGKAREFAVAEEKLRALADLPPPVVAA